jgi:tagatose-1,6-bisphosphate aldolase
VSVQNALKIIRQYREKENENCQIFATLKNLVDMSAQEDLPFSIEELKKAFQIDWDMRWLKHS